MQLSVRVGEEPITKKNKKTESLLNSHSGCTVLYAF